MTAFVDNVTEKKYTLVYRGAVVINSDDLPLLEEGLVTLQNTAATFIHYNETGIKAFELEKAA